MVPREADCLASVLAMRKIKSLRSPSPKGLDDEMKEESLSSADDDGGATGAGGTDPWRLKDVFPKKKNPYTSLHFHSQKFSAARQKEM